MNRVATSLALAALAVAAHPTSILAEQKPPAVELRLKVATREIERVRVLWAVELSDSNWNPVAQTTMIGGDRARFKNLEPGIYTICVSGIRRGRRCSSADLTPASGERQAIFEVQVPAPAFARSAADLMTVSVASLAVPRKARQELRRSIAARQRGEPDESLARLRRALDICPDYAQALNDLGAYFHRKEDYAQAVRLFTRAAELEPDYFAAWLNLGKSYMALRDYAKAVEASGHALSFRPDDLMANGQLALGHYFLKDFAAAKKYFQRVAELDPASPSLPHLYLARIAFSERRRDDGARYLRSYLVFHPNSPQAEQYRAVLRNLLGDTAAAGDVGGISLP
jgi:tetratricopeptide (TPR) repeat protein